MRSYLTLAVLAVVAAQAASKEFVCYWESWHRWRPAQYQLPAEKLPINLCTHIIYSFTGLDTSTWRIKQLDDQLDSDFKKFAALKQKNPKLKISFAVGGYSEGVVNYSNLVANAENRKKFVASVVEWIKRYGFDGFDLDWEHPGASGNNADKQNCNLLLQEMRAALDTVGGKKYLTYAVYSTQEKINIAYDVPTIAKYCDFIHVMTYDLRGTWDHMTGNHANLYSLPTDQGILREFSVDQGMKNWVKAGAPKSKLIMGIAFYGRSFTLQNAANNGQRAPIAGAGTQGAVSQEAGNLFYFEICERLKQGWTRKFDNDGKVPYAFSGNQWVGYEDVEGIKHKMAVLNKEGYGGALTWAIGLDDHANLCGQGAFPLANAVVKGLGGGNGGDDNNFTTASPSPTPSPTPGPTPSPNPGPVADCSSGAAFIPHTKYCNKYFMCVNAQPLEYSCPAPLIYDHSANVCNWPASVPNPLPKGCTMA